GTGRRWCGRSSGGGRAGSVRLWGHRADEVSRLRQSRTSPRLEHVVLPDRVLVRSDEGEALADATMVIVAVPTQFIRPVLERVGKHVPRGASIVSVSKGFEVSTLYRPLQIARDVLDGDADSPRPSCVLAGPTIASELARCLPATMVAASEDAGLARRVQGLFNTSWLRIYTSGDPVGVEVAGAAKNVIAIAAGILDGLQAGSNAKAALLARGLSEITRLGTALGAQSETFFGIAGVGDLATTCFSPEGRNRSCGEALGRGEKLEHYLGRTSSVVEGVETARSLLQLARHHGVEMPIAAGVHAVLHEGVDPIDAITALMRRDVREERVG
ncbi:MAG: NAD(P)H-dependent glycerol-3-phosphate dehydrogenase, partial [Phycisphaerales bacterium]